ncbi:MurR/RpiR family transcriptional regulator [Lactobacillus sp. ESL0731]|uniref:MurR/RpiR family transcriptional regulator n=1 Tax=unclassified Lactobacillus TaxID=2620435 RepID=UPI0023F959AA|nr:MULTISPECIES: MurR/RpiR family transcriptional regulator [unclassified Lactobacillus]WEV51618.1 MurR/RpiR family transcriptional regulator [Lactobacillus sp. ESL0700]WEV62747.1 MurR/RpiR family transcriptional regulator [Lactobacillus sp. ESL0731]
MNPLVAIQKNYLIFSKNEKIIADYILQNSPQINNMKIKDLAKKTSTSCASITRFVKKIGCQSYSDMKINIGQHLISTAPEQENDILNEVFDFYQTVIKNTQQMVDQNLIKEFVNLLKKQKQIIVIGASSSGTSARTFGLRLMRMGIDALSIDDPYWMQMRASIATKHDLFFAVSNSGITDCVVKTLNFAKKKEAKIVSITSYLDNPVAQLSDLTFHVYNPRFANNKKFINSQFSNMYLIDILTSYLQEEQSFKEAMQNTRKAIGDK